MSVGLSTDEMREQAPLALARILGLPEGSVVCLAYDRPGVDLELRADGHVYALALATTASTGSVRRRAETLLRATETMAEDSLAAMVVPFASEPIARTCEEAGASWFDLSGNARLIAPGLRVIIQGRPNSFRRPGRPANLFAPKSSRMVRWLLINYATPATQRHIALETGLSEGYVSQTAARLERDHYLSRRENGTVQVRDPAALLEAWRGEYRFNAHKVIAGSVAARSGIELTSRVAVVLSELGADHAATAMSAAWQYQRFAAYRIATFYLSDPPTSAQKKALGFREEERGANLRLVVPRDAGVFGGAHDVEGVRCVHPVQAYLDLKAHPERAAEAADRLRAELVSGWRAHG